MKKRTIQVELTIPIAERDGQFIVQDVICMQKFNFLYYRIFLPNYKDLSVNRFYLN